jgi:hypothetical protein
MGMYKTLKDVYDTFYNDETLLRLLHYLPQSYIDNRKDPLDPSLDNVLKIDTYSEIRDEIIKLTSKSSDLENKKICRLYLYADVRKPIDGGYIYSDQNIVVDIFCHSDYEKDLRSMRISDRLNELLIGSRVTGFGKVSYVGGRPISAPLDYVAYSHKYKIGSMRK